MVKSKILPYKFSYLSMVKNIWTHSKNIEHGQKYLNIEKKRFELADGIGIISKSLSFDHVQKIWRCSKFIEQAQKDLNVVKIIFELADGTGIS